MDIKRAQELIKKFNQHNVLVVGDVCLDQYITGVVERLNPEAPVPILHATGARAATGCAGNVAKNVAALGVKAHLVSVVGDDESAGAVESQAEKEGYAVNLVRDGSRPTIRKVRHLAGSQQLLRVDYEATHDVTGQVFHQLLGYIQQVVDQGIDAILISDYAKGVLTFQLGQELAALAQNKKLFLSADIKPSRVAAMRGVRLVTPNLKEAHEYVGLNFLEQQLAPEEIALRVREKLQCDVFVTLGARGVYILPFDAAQGRHVPQQHVVEVFDVSGAGDTFMVTLTLALLSGASAEEAAWLANAAGAVVVGKVGSVGVTEGELLDMMARSHE